MASDGEFLTPRQLRALSLEEQQRYLREQLAAIFENDSEDEQELNFHPYAEEDVNLSIHAEHSDAEEMQLPQFDQDEESDSEEEVEDATEGEMNSNNYISRDGIIWSTEAPSRRRILMHNILRSRNTGPTLHTEGLSILQTFKLLMTDEMCDIIVRETNRKANQCYENFRATRATTSDSTWQPLTIPEFHAYLGILLMAGVSHSGYVHTTDLWKTFSNPLYRASMGIRRFWAISRYIRFDNGNTREERKKVDKAAAISDIFLMLNRNLQHCYIAGANVTVDEQLYPYRGGTGFTQYIPSKPAKYGIKVWWVCDSITSYPLKGEIYTGLAPSGVREKNMGERVVKNLCCNLFRGSGRTIVCDNLFTSDNLATILKDDYNLALLGTVNKRRTFVPFQFANPKGRETLSTLFGFSNNVTICSYVPKKNKAVVLLSTAHYTTEVAGPNKKPVIIHDYNRSKGGVDTMDKCLDEYSTKRRTNRWPLAFFYNILDVAAFGAFVIYMDNNPHLKSSTSRRRIFLQQLSQQLAMPEIERRSKNPQIMRNFSTRNGIEAMLGHQMNFTTEGTPERTQVERDASGRIKHKGNCYLCQRRRPTRKACSTCLKPVCVQHSFESVKCQRCNENNL